MNDLQTAAQQALEALDAGVPISPKSILHDWFRAALAQQAEPVEPVAWTLTKTLTERKTTTNGFLWFSDPVNSSWTALYTAPPQRTMVPLTEEEILAAVGWERAAMYMKLAPNFPVDEAKKETLTNARAVEKAVWEKNNGQA